MTQIAELLARREPVVNLLTPERTVADAARLMTDRAVGAVLIASSGHLEGIFTERDVVWRVLAAGRDPQETALKDVMTREPSTAAPEDDVREAVEKMRRASCRHLPVLVGGQVADTLSMRDLLSTELAEREDQVEKLESYIRGDRVVDGESSS